MRKQSRRFAGLLAEAKQQIQDRQWAARLRTAAAVSAGTMQLPMPPLASAKPSEKDQRPPKHPRGFSERYLARMIVARK